LERALEKFKRWTKSDVIEYLERMMKMRPADSVKTDYITSLLVPVKDKLTPVSLDDVACIYSTDRKTQVYLKNKRVMDYNRSLDSIIGSLDPAHFFRANKQYIVARDCVKEIVIWFDSRLLLKLPVELPEPLFVSKNKAAEFKNWITTN
jgi:DNA-binding LytR/AlgR family response regulator